MIVACSDGFESVADATVRYTTKGALRRELAAFESGGARGSDWLSERERLALDSLRDTSRREDWRLGRWMLKQLVTERLHGRCPSALKWWERAEWMRRIELLPRMIDGLSTRPVLVVDGAVTAIPISLSHATAGVLAAVAHRPEIQLGVDLVTQVHPRVGFLRLWFTEYEQTWLARRPELAMLAWGAKEATYKAVQRGERFVPLACEVTLIDDDAFRCRYRNADIMTDVQFSKVGSDCWAVLAKRQMADPFHLSQPVCISLDGVFS